MTEYDFTKKSPAEVKAFLKRLIRDKPNYDDLSATDQAFFLTIVKKYNAWVEKQKISVEKQMN
jgi:hypothetical protein